MIVDEVKGFAREYINKPPTRTAGRKAKIREAYKVLTGKTISISCATCYIEAIFKILNLTNMASSKYEIRKGVVLQVFGDPSKTCTNATITDELGDYYLKNHPEKLRFFTKYPKPEPVKAVAPKTEPAKVEPVEEVIKEEVKEPEISTDLPVEAEAVIAAMTGGTKRRTTKPKK